MSTLVRLRQRVADLTTCREVGRVLQSYLDGELDDLQVRNVTAHLERCRRCGLNADTYARIQLALWRAGQDRQMRPEDDLAIERLRRFATTLSAE